MHLRSPLALALCALSLAGSAQARPRHPADQDPGLCHRRPPVVIVRHHPRRPAAVQVCPGPDLVWVPGHPGPRGRWVDGYCRRVGPAPREGWVYVSGYWNGRLWVTGFWRPSIRVGFHWVDAQVNERDEYVAGYWEPDGPAPEGMIWRPGYWDGARWVEPGWVPSESYTTYDENGEVEFFAVGDGHVEELALPATDEEQEAFDVPQEDGEKARHHDAPE